MEQGFTSENLERLKLIYTWKTLKFRRQNKELFVGGEYIPIEVKGDKERNIVGFIRKRGKKIALAAAARFFTSCLPNAEIIFPPDFWKNTELIWPKDLEIPEKLKDVVFADSIDIAKQDQKATIKAGDLFKHACARLLTNYGE